MTRGVSFSPEAEKQLLALYPYIADAKSADVAHGYVSAIVEFCQSIGEFPHRGTARDDLRLGLETVGFRRRVTIALAVDKDERVTVVGLFYAVETTNRFWRTADLRQPSAILGFAA